MDPVTGSTKSATATGLGSGRRKRCRKRNRKRPGRVERLKEELQRKSEKVDNLSQRTAALRSFATKITTTNKALKRKLNETELENILLRDPHSRSSRLFHLNQSGTIGTSGCFTHSAISLFRCIRIISQTEFSEPALDTCLGEGRFGKCYLRSLGHYKVCVKVFKKFDNNALTHEANILAKFIHPNLPYLFGVCMETNPCIVTSFHGYNNGSLTIHRALFKKVELDIDWMDMLVQVICGIKHLHSKCKILHNDLKGDNIVFASSMITGSLGAVIIDFGKACEAGKGESYKLSEKQKEYYKLHHPHIAPDLRDGKCKQSISSDIFSFGRIMNIVNKTIVMLKTDEVLKISSDCMQYDSSIRPDASHLHELILHVASS